MGLPFSEFMGLVKTGYVHLQTSLVEKYGRIFKIVSPSKLLVGDFIVLADPQLIKVNRYVTSTLLCR